MFDLNQIEFRQPTAEDVRVLRARMGISQKELAAMLNLCPNVVSQYESGRRNMVTGNWVMMQVVYYRDFAKKG